MIGRLLVTLALALFSASAALAQGMTEAQEAWLTRGYDALDRTDPVGALEASAALLADDTASEYVRTMAHEIRGLVRIGQKDFTAALADFQYVLSTTQESGTRRYYALYLASVAGTELGQLDTVKPYIEEYIATADDQFANAYYLLARQTYAAGDIEATIRHLDEALRRASEDFSGINPVEPWWLELNLRAHIQTDDADGIQRAFRMIAAQARDKNLSIEAAAKVHEIGDCKNAKRIADDIMMQWPVVESAETTARVYVDCLYGREAVDAIRVLVASKSESEYASTMLLAIVEDNGQRITKLADEGLAVDGQIGREHTLLILAVRLSHTDAVKTLLAAGADPLAANEDGVTPLQAAQETGLYYTESLIRDALGIAE